MNNLRFPLVFSIAALLLPSIVLADDDKPKPERGERPARPEGREGRPGGEGRRGMGDPEQRIKMLTEKLELTADQQEKIRTAMKENAEKNREAMAAIRDDGALSPEQKREKFQALMKGQTEKLAEILTPEQKAKYLELQKEMGQRMRDGGGREGRRPDGEGGRKPEGDRGPRPGGEGDKPAGGAEKPKDPIL